MTMNAADRKNLQGVTLDVARLVDTIAVARARLDLNHREMARATTTDALVQAERVLALLRALSG